MKKTLWTMFVLLIAVPLFAGNAKSAKNAKNAVQPVATIGNVVVSEEELAEAVGTKLTRLLTDVYTLRRTVLDDLISNKLLEAEAKRRGMTVEELMKVEVAEKITQPDMAEIERLYEGVSERFGGMPKEQAVEEISKSTRDKRILARKAEYIRELHDAAGVRVNLQPPRVAVKAEGPSRGNATAPVTIIEFSDFECQFCGRAVETLKKIEDNYGDKVRIVFRDFPLAFHRTAKRAAEAGHCANEYGKFWEMHDKLFSKGGPVSDGEINRFAVQIGLDQQRFQECMSSGRFKEAWKPALEEAQRLGVQSTPTFFINGRLIVGAASYEAFSRIIDEELALAKTQKTDTKVAAR